MFSIILGTASHLVWDSLTHFDSLLSTFSPGLYFANAAYFSKILQYLSTVIGLFFCCWYILEIPNSKMDYNKLYCRNHTNAINSYVYWCSILIINFLMIVFAFQIRKNRHGFVSIINYSVAGFLIAITLMAIFEQILFFPKGIKSLYKK